MLLVLPICSSVLGYVLLRLTGLGIPVDGIATLEREQLRLRALLSSISNGEFFISLSGKMKGGWVRNNLQQQQRKAQTNRQNKRHKQTNGQKKYDIDLVPVEVFPAHNCPAELCVESGLESEQANVHGNMESVFLWIQLATGRGLYSFC